MGAKVSTMRRKADDLALGDGLVLLEIGGNDLLGSTSLADFERDLDELLQGLRGPGRIVVMFELPLPPFCNGFGRAQRRLAHKNNVRLIPKRVFVEVLTTEGATVDSVHLSRRGHELMAATVWDIIQPAFAKDKQ
jgi:acyl-CoA thioesterase-1